MSTYLIPCVSLKEKIFQLAHFLKNTSDLTWSASLVQAWKSFKLRYLMNQGCVDFSFILKDNSICYETRGTLRNLPTSKESHKFDSDLGTFRYWDLGSNSFKAFSVQNLVNINL